MSAEYLSGAGPDIRPDTKLPEESLESRLYAKFSPACRGETQITRIPACGVMTLQVWRLSEEVSYGLRTVEDAESVAEQKARDCINGPGFNGISNVMECKQPRSALIEAMFEKRDLPK